MKDFLFKVTLKNESLKTLLFGFFARNTREKPTTADHILNTKMFPIIYYCVNFLNEYNNN